MKIMIFKLKRKKLKVSSDMIYSWILDFLREATSWKLRFNYLPRDFD